MRNLFLVLLTVSLLFSSCKTKPQPQIEIIEPEIEIEEIEEVVLAEIPEIVILEPEFEVVSIRILQADIVVTEFETVLKITNPNEFALNINSLTYELFGNGASWAKGSGKNILHIPANSATETKFNFEMNFINMNRRLLDDVIAMRQIRYRFKGDAIGQAVIPDIKTFMMKYDCIGLSDVRKN